MAKAVNPRVAALIYGDGAESADFGLNADLQLQHLAPAGLERISARPGEAQFVKSLQSAIASLPSEIEWIWLLDVRVELAQDALYQLARKAEISPSAAWIGSKQLQQQERSLISSLGISLSQRAEPVRLYSGEFDQGQHDGESDVLAVDPNCSLVLRSALIAELDALAETPGDAFGYELGMRLRASGSRVLVEPAARCWVPPTTGASSLLAQFSSLTTRIHLSALVLPFPVVALLWFAAPLLVVVAVAAAFLRKLPVQAIAAPAAIAWGWVTILKRLRARASLRSLGDVRAQSDFWLSRAAFRKLRMVNLAQTASSLDNRLRLLESGIFWWAAVPLLAGYQLFSMAAPRSAELPPISGSLPELIRAAFTQIQPYWDGVSGASDPSSWFWLVFGLLSPADPGVAVGWFIFLSPALIFLVAARLVAEFTQSRTAIVVLGIAYALNPVLALALLQGNAAAIALQLWIPVLVLAARQVWLNPRERSWSWWAVLGLATFFVSTLFPMVGATWLVLFLIAVVVAHPKKLSAALLSLAPAAVLLTSFGLQLAASSALWLVVQPTMPRTPELPVLWLVPLGLIFLTWGLSIERINSLEILTAMTLLAATGSWFLIAQLASFLLSFALMLALVALARRHILQASADSSIPPSRLATRVTLAIIAIASLVAGYILASQTPQFDRAGSTLMPALVAATAEVDPLVRTLVIDTSGDPAIAELFWNDGRHLDERSLLHESSGGQQEIETRQQVARLVAGLLAGNSQVAGAGLEQLRVAYILIVSPTAEVTRSLSTVSGLASSGLTDFGELWRNTQYQATSMSSISPNPAQWAIIALLMMLVLLAIPKPRSGRRSSVEAPIFDEVAD